MNNHTPGPWMIYDDGDIASASVRVPEHTVLRSGSVKGATIGEAMANAKLIAAAPSLLAALQDLIMLAAQHRGKAAADSVARARAAIKAAT